MLFENPLPATLDFFARLPESHDLYGRPGYCVNLTLLETERKRSSIGSLLNSFTRRIWKDEERGRRRCNFTVIVAHDERMKPMLENLRRIMLLTRQPFQTYESPKQDKDKEKENMPTNRLSSSSTIDTFSESNPFRVHEAGIKSSSGKKLHDKDKENIFEESEGYLSARSAEPL